MAVMTLPTITLFLTLACLFCPSASVAEPVGETNLDTDAHLAGWWRFDETSGTAAADSSAHDRVGKLSGGLSFDEHSVPGRVGKALRFDGNDDLVQITGYKGVQGTTPRSISVWIKTDAVTGEIVSWGKEDYGQMWKLEFIRKFMGMHPGGGYFYMAAKVHDNVWHHVAAVTREAELPNLHDDVTLYLDGKIAEIHNIGILDLWPIETGSGLDVAIGKKFKGAIDELRVYDRELTDEEIAELYSAGN